MIYEQTRLGLDGVAYKVYKFRTMIVGARDMQKKGVTDEKLITPVGRFLRRTFWDETLQLFNILKGDMSLVGPRPEVSKFLSGCSPEVREKLFSVRPGLTGLSKLRFWNEATLLEDADDVEQTYLAKIVPVKLQTDVWYVVHRTFWLDLRIIGITLIRFLTGSRFFRSVSSLTNLPYQEERL